MSDDDAFAATKAVKKKATKSKASSSSTQGKAKKAKIATVSEAQGEQMILEYLTKSNRPYSHTQVFENLHGVIKKVSVPRLLEKLASAGKIRLKVFKKTKIFLADQSRFPPLDNVKIAELDESIELARAQLKERGEAVAKLEKEVASLGSVLSDDGLAKQLESIEKKVSETKEKLAAMSGSTLTSKDDIRKMQMRFNVVYLAWKKRKRAVDEMAEAVLENAPKSKTKKKFFEQAGVESDEEANAPDIKTFEQYYKKL